MRLISQFKYSGLLLSALLCVLTFLQFGGIPFLKKKSNNSVALSLKTPHCSHSGSNRLRSNKCKGQHSHLLCPSLLMEVTAPAQR